MWIIAGLGNPGAQYRNTRHNIGFEVVDLLARRCGAVWKTKGQCEWTTGEMERTGGEVLLLKPMAYMNRSGPVVDSFVRNTPLGPQGLIVIHDDIDMDTGRIRIRQKGSSGGHRGVQSIMESLGSGDFLRVKIGIGRDPALPVEEYVLRRFRQDEKAAVEEAVVRAGEAVRAIVGDGLEKAMNVFNR